MKMLLNLLNNIFKIQVVKMKKLWIFLRSIEKTKIKDLKILEIFKCFGMEVESLILEVFIFI